MKTTVLTVARNRSVWAGLALGGIVFLASCQSQSEIRPVGKTATDSTTIVSVNEDPPVKPSGPGGE